MYRLQGVKINDKHIEVIVRQMLRRVVITDPGDTKFITGEQVERSEMLDENEKALAENKRPATYDNRASWYYQGISLSTDSLHLGCVLPGNDPSAYRSSHHGQT